MEEIFKGSAKLLFNAMKGTKVQNIGIAGHMLHLIQCGTQV